MPGASQRVEDLSSVAITAYESFNGWTKKSIDPRLCRAIVDLLTYDGYIVETR